MLWVLIWIALTNTHNICLYKEVDKKYTGCSLKTKEPLDCALIGVCEVNRLNTVYNIWTIPFYYLTMCIKVAGWAANSVEPDQTLSSVASELGLNCLLRPIWILPVYIIFKLYKTPCNALKSTFMFLHFVEHIFYSLNFTNTIICEKETFFNLYTKSSHKRKGGGYYSFIIYQYE